MFCRGNIPNFKLKTVFLRPIIWYLFYTKVIAGSIPWQMQALCVCSKKAYPLLAGKLKASRFPDYCEQISIFRNTEVLPCCSEFLSGRILDLASIEQLFSELESFRKGYSAAKLWSVETLQKKMISVVYCWSVRLCLLGRGSRLRIVDKVREKLFHVEWRADSIFLSRVLGEFSCATNTRFEGLMLKPFLIWNKCRFSQPLNLHFL